MFQTTLPDEYRTMTTAQAQARIAAVKKRLGRRMVILGHHYQRQEVIDFADFRGDSLKLSQLAAEQNAEFIVFCGVHFMAESADILAQPDQKVLLPDLSAGCPMADMAAPEQVEQCWAVLAEKAPGRRVVPVTYVNSSAKIKAFCGCHSGLCCTSGNARAVLSHVWGQDPQALVLFLPDQHLGRNTGYALGKPLDSMVLWDPYEHDGGITGERLEKAAMVLWDGFCAVHQQFTAEQIARARAADPDVKVIVHPECRWEVVQAADEAGSTEAILRIVGQAAPGSHWLVGTEMHLVERLARDLVDRDIRVDSLSETPTPCETMFRIDPQHLAWLLDRLDAHLASGGAEPLVNRVHVDEAIKRDARVALEAMLGLRDQPGGK